MRTICRAESFSIVRFRMRKKIPDDPLYIYDEPVVVFDVPIPEIVPEKNT